MEGFNGALLAYGQAGSGKTYTLQGEYEEEGLIPRIIDFMFAHIGKKKAEVPPSQFD